MQIRELGHIVIGVRDLERSARFYGQVLGLRNVARIRETGLMFIGGQGRSHHELLLVQVDADAAAAPDALTFGQLGLRHTAWKVGTTDAELQAALRDLEQAEVPIDHVTNHGDITHSIYLRDPDGNAVELYIDVQPELWRDTPAVAGVMGTSTRPLTLPA